MKPIMTIKAPRGKCRIYPVAEIRRWWLDRHSYTTRNKPFNETERETYNRFHFRETNKRGRMVKAFMRGVGRNNGSSSSRPREHTAKAH